MHDIQSSEADRLRALQALRLLDTPPEEVFDRVTRLASKLLDVPIALFSLVDHERQWWKSRIGVAGEGTPRGQAFCAFAVAGSEPLVVTDATLDQRFMDNPLVTGSPHIRFYAGVPIRTAAGHAIGTLCTLDTVARTLSDADLATLVDLAQLITAEVRYREAALLASAHIVDTARAVSASDAHFRAAFEQAGVGIGALSPDGKWLSVNASLCKTVGYSLAELQAMEFRELTYEPDRVIDQQLIERLVANDIDEYQVVKRYVRKDGVLVWVNVSVSKKLNPAKQVEYFIAVVKDINARVVAERRLAQLHAELEERVAARTEDLVQANARLHEAVERQAFAEQEMRKREAELSSVLENANDAYISLDQQGRVRAWNRQAEHTFGWRADEAMGRGLEDLILPASMAVAHRDGMARYRVTGEAQVLGSRLELPARRKDGSELTVEIRIRALEIHGQVIFSAFLHDISERKDREERARFESRHDALTGLLNRRALLEAIPLAQARATRLRSPMGLLFLDLDGFKAVNDTHGHDTGDELLRAIAAILVGAVRKTDSVYRLAGDEFMVILEGLGEPPVDGHRVANKLVRAIGAPHALASATVAVSASIGIAVFLPGSDTTADALVKEADHHMYAAKRAGRGRIAPAEPATAR